jgi:hypothetical protein
VWRPGTGTPSDGLGSNGDFYFETDTYHIWVRTLGAYVDLGSVAGAAGATGATGATGTAGATGTTGAGGITIINNGPGGLSTHTDGTFDQLGGSSSIGAGRFATDSSKIFARFGCTTAAHATATRQFQLKFGSNILLDSGAFATTSAGSIDIDLWITRVDTGFSEGTHVAYVAKLVSSGAAVNPIVSVGELTGLDLGADFSILLFAAAAGTGAAYHDIHLPLYYVGYSQ